MAPLKALLFDIGGVLVLSPFQAIIDYETENHIPSGWINFAISRSSPNGSWQRLERGEIALDDDFFQGFSHDLHDPHVWAEFQRRPRTGRKALKDLALANPTRLGDPVSLKVEAADSEPTDQDRGTQSSTPPGGSESTSETNDARPTKSLKELAKENPTQLGDPVSLKAETADSEPTEHDRGAASSPSPPADSPFLSRTPQSPPKPQCLKDLATRNPSQLGDPISLKAKTADSQPTDQDRGARSPPRPTSTAPPPPFTISARTLFPNMTAHALTPDPHLSPYLTHLSLLTPRPLLLGALSNTIPFPPTHPLATGPSPSSPLSPLRRRFDVFVASAEVGLRKPQRAIYELALRELDRVDKGRGGRGVSPGEVLFVDDIAENVRAAQEVGMRGLRVRLGGGEEALRVLEEVTGVRRGGGGASKL
ncbi:Acyl-CoA dehydrogenase member 10 [Xylographa carneopallida]|nr:Acyl-CoA dehydrogenase member 10 [Xylographa carneopallida]